MPDNAVQTPQPRAGRRVRRLFVALLLILFAGPVLISWAQTEITEWSLAASYEQELLGRLGQRPLAAGYGHPLVARPQRPVCQTGQHDPFVGRRPAALPDCDRAVELAREQRSDSLPNLAIALNQRAYAYALSQRNLEEALQRH